MGDFVCRAVEGVPGVASAAACLPGAERPRLGGEPVPQCADCDVHEGDIDHDPSHPCRLSNRAGFHIFPLKTQDRHFGFLLLKLEERERYAPYEPFVSNMANSLAVNIDRQWQKERLEAANVELEATNKELEAFCYSVSHDLRAPLRGMEGFSRVLLEDHAASLNKDGLDCLQRISAAAKRMGELIDDLLELSRITRASMKSEPADLSALAAEVSGELRKSQPERIVEFVIGQTPAVKGDANLLRVALENLLGNSWKFTGKRPQARIEFGTADRDGEAAFFVRDNGAGFDMAYAGKLFGAFQRLHSGSEFPGNGIGLASTQRIILRHGGRIWAESAPGRETTFYFTIKT